ncbi:unnamed protein product [Symbiodinium natans]|uniref:Uncharacterized protein n=1 Tax=Symbiodinium natans TaxID=878477 RepID=A0A812S0P7_9DINO|nr:unnamed protein product [Symbiodinium natans]
MMHHANAIMLASVATARPVPFAIREIFTSKECDDGSSTAAAVRDMARVCRSPPNFHVRLNSRTIVYTYYETSDVSCSGTMIRSEVVPIGECVLDQEASESNNESRYTQWTLRLHEAVVEQVYASEGCSGSPMETNALILGVCDEPRSRMLACKGGMIEELHYADACSGDNQSWMAFPVQSCIPHHLYENRSRRFTFSSCDISSANRFTSILASLSLIIWRILRVGNV